VLARCVAQERVRTAKPARRVSAMDGASRRIARAAERAKQERKGG